MKENQKYKRIIQVLSLLALLMIPLYLLFQMYVFPQEDSSGTKEPQYVGGNLCLECHQKEFEDWKGSDHDLAMTEATAEFVLGDFSDVEITRKGQTHKAFKKGDDFFVLTDGPDGKMQEYLIKYTFGHYPLQQYLVEFEEGRLQTLALTWNSKDSIWYYMADSVYRDMNVNHENWLHWTNQSQNWNSMCADCHSTNLKTGYQHESQSYNTTWSEIDVSCEACHGPASEHMVWAEKPEYLRDREAKMGLSVQTSNIDNEAFVNICARCHSRRSSLSDYAPHDKSIYNHMIPVLPVEPQFHIDGQILDEDYVFASFTQSKMYMNDVQCNDCHNVHSGQLILEGNALCLQCHQADTYDSPQHHFHKAKGEDGKGLISEAGVFYDVGSGTECINCHMHGQNYMGVDYRRDHSFRIPRPDLTKKLGSPNACNQCHTQETADWAQSYIEKWHGSSRPFQYGEAFHNANLETLGSNEQLIKMIEDELYPLNIRSAAIMYLGQQSHPRTKEIIYQSLKSIHPLIRIYSIRKMDVQDPDDLEQLFPLLYDETKAVRIEMASKLALIPAEYIPEKHKEMLQKNGEEYLEVLEFNSDFPLGKYNLGNYYYNRADYKNAEKYYLMALEQDQELHQLKMNLAIMYSGIGRAVEAEELLANYIEAVPEDYSAYYNYGLILAENKKYKESLKYLEIASDELPYNSRVDYNIAMLYEFEKDLMKTELYLLKALKKENSETNYSNLYQFYNRTQQQKKAEKLAEEIRTVFGE